MPKRQKIKIYLVDWKKICTFAGEKRIRPRGATE